MPTTPRDPPTMGPSFAPVFGSLFCQLLTSLSDTNKESMILIRMVCQISHLVWLIAYPDQCQQYAGTLQVYSERCQGHACILNSVSGMQNFGYWVFDIVWLYRGPSASPIDILLYRRECFKNQVLIAKTWIQPGSGLSCPLSLRFIFRCFDLVLPPYLARGHWLHRSNSEWLFHPATYGTFLFSSK